MRARKDKKYILPFLIGRGWGVGLLLLLLLTACHDDDGPDGPDPDPKAAAWTVDVLGGGAVETDDEGRITQRCVCDSGLLESQIERNIEEISVEFWNNDGLSDLRNTYYGIGYGDPCF